MNKNTLPGKICLQRVNNNAEIIPDVITQSTLVGSGIILADNGNYSS